MALEQSLENIGEIVLRFHQLNDLEALLSYGVGVIQELFESDRTLIYQFLPTGDGVVIAESVKEDWQPIIGQLIYDPCFENHWAQQYRRGRVRQISDVEQSDLAPCHIEFLTQLQVKANLIVPIVVRQLSNSQVGEEQELWGLLIIQQCSAPRIWQSLEVQVLKQLSLQMGIAIAHIKAQNKWQANLQKQEQLQASLQQEQERWQLAIQGSNDGIWDWNILTDELFISPRWKEILGYNDDEIENSLEAWESHLHPDDLSQVKQAIQDHLIHKNAFFAIEQRMRCKDGSYKWILARAQAVWDEAGRAVRMVGFHTDISDRKQAEQELQRSVAELTRLNQLKDDFLSTVSHELRTPMSNIKMATQMLEIQLKSLGVMADESNLLNQYFEILDTECQREIKLINDLLNLTLLDAETEPLNCTYIDPSYWIPHICEPFIKQSQQHQQRFNMEIAHDLPSITTDLSYLERIVTELLTNACKYTPAGEVINLLVQGNAETLDIIVSNSGVEISAVERDRIFDKFYRIPNHDPWKYGGTGLGLTLVKKMVNCLGGTISVSSSSQPSMTTFSIHLPLT